MALQEAMVEDQQLAQEVQQFLTETERQALQSQAKAEATQPPEKPSPRAPEETPPSSLESTPESTEAATSADTSTERTEGGGTYRESGGVSGAGTYRDSGASDMDRSTERTEGAEEEMWSAEREDALSAEREEALVRYLMKLPCGHIFHEVCMERWFSVGRTCPICRQDVTASDLLPAAAASGPSTHRSLESGETTLSQCTPREEHDEPKHMSRIHPREVFRHDGSHARSAAPTPLRPAVPKLNLGKNRGSDTSSPINSTRTLSARSAHSGHHSARLTMSPRSAFTDAPPRSHRSQASDGEM